MEKMRMVPEFAIYDRVRIMIQDGEHELNRPSRVIPNGQQLTNLAD